jgi:8-oxo-dGTP pyrophosphatase MutT (NUDIX family)
MSARRFYVGGGIWGEGSWTAALSGGASYDERVPKRDTRPLFQFSAGGLVVDDDGRVLLIRARDLRGRPVWTLPKGALVEGESSEEAALREVREETGYQCKVVRGLEVVTYWFQHEGRRIRKTVRWFLMRPVEKVGEHDHEVDEVQWASPEEAATLLRYDSDRRLIGVVTSADGGDPAQGEGNSRSALP